MRISGRFSSRWPPLSWLLHFSSVHAFPFIVRVVAVTNCLLVCELHGYGDQSLISHISSAQCSAWCMVLLSEKGINEEGMRWMQNLVSLMTLERTF